MNLGEHKHSDCNKPNLTISHLNLKGQGISGCIWIVQNGEIETEIVPVGCLGLPSSIQVC